MMPASQAATTQAPIRGLTATSTPATISSDAHQVHALVGVAGHNAVDPAGQIFAPVVRPGQDIEELVQPEHDRGDRENDSKQQKRLKRRRFSSGPQVWRSAAACLVLMVGSSF